MGNDLFSVRLNAAALAAAHSFLLPPKQGDIPTGRVWVEHVPGTAVRLLVPFWLLEDRYYV